MITLLQLDKEMLRSSTTPRELNRVDPSTTTTSLENLGRQRPQRGPPTWSQFLDVVEEGKPVRRSPSAAKLLKRVRSVMVRQRSETAEKICRLQRSLSAKVVNRSSSGSSLGRTSSADRISQKSEDESPHSPEKRILRKALSKKEKYFAERHDKNIFKKLLHPNYQERNSQFKRLFIDRGLVDRGDTFLASYSCAYQREILCQGRMYISQLSFSFYANIFGWETHVVIPIHDVHKISKQRTAKIFPNSVQVILKSGEKFFFASFTNREKTVSVLTFVHDKSLFGKLVAPAELWEYLKNSDTKDSPLLSPTLTAESVPTPTSDDGGEMPKNGDDYKKGERRKDSSQSSLEPEDDDVSCRCAEHPGNLVLDCVFPVTTQRMHHLLFTDSEFNNALRQKLNDTNYASSSWTHDVNGVESRTVTYTVAINQPMAPKTCLASERQVINYLPRPKDGFVVQKETQNSGVPYADHFVVQCSYCVTRVNRTSCRLKVHAGLMFKKSTWAVIRGYIEKSTYQGVDEHYHTLEALLGEECARYNEMRELDEQQDAETASVASAVEDPNPGTGSGHARHVAQSIPAEPDEPRRASSALHRHIDQTANAQRSLVAVPDARRASEQDYRFLIAIIIFLLAALLALNFVLLVHVTRSSVSDEKLARTDVAANVAVMSEKLAELAVQVQSIQAQVHSLVRLKSSEPRGEL